MMSKVAFIAGLVLILSLESGTSVLGADVPAKAFSATNNAVDELLKPWMAWHSLTGFLVEYEVRSKAPPIYRLTAMARPGSLYSFSGHFLEGGYSWQVDPYAQEFFLHKGMACHQWPAKRTFSNGRVRPGDSIPGSLPQDDLLPVLPVWLLSDHKVPTFVGSDVILPPAEALGSGKYRLLPGSELIRGEECIVFEREGHDRIWLAKTKGLCVMRRDISDPRLGSVKQRILTEKTGEVAPGLWLPIDYRRQLLASRPSTNGPEMVALELRTHIRRLTINSQVPDSTFVPVHRPGALEYDALGEFRQVTAGGEELLSEIVDFCVKHVGLPSKGAPRVRSFVWLLGGIVCGMCIGLMCFPGGKGKVTALRKESRVNEPSSALGPPA